MQIKKILNEGKEKLIRNNIEDASMQAKVLMKYVLKNSRKFFNYKCRKRA